jgi:hypothetical protein
MFIFKSYSSYNLLYNMSFIKTYLLAYRILSKAEYYTFLHYILPGSPFIIHLPKIRLSLVLDGHLIAVYRIIGVDKGVYGRSVYAYRSPNRNSSSIMFRSLVSLLGKII